MPQPLYELFLNPSNANIATPAILVAAPSSAAESPSSAAESPSYRAQWLPDDKSSKCGGMGYARRTINSSGRSEHEKLMGH